MRSSTLFWMSVALAACATGASAQRMYRCGSTYQDRPCETGVADKVFRSGGAEAAGANVLKSVADPDCIQRGVQAQQIMWARESGKTAEQLSQQAAGESQRRLIAEVYALRGSAPQVRETIQAKCQQDKERAASNPVAPVKPAASEATRGFNPAGTPVSGYNACDDYKAQLENTRSQERQGGSVQLMESLRQRRSSLESTARAQGCR
ncbi:MAG: hypothetical protein HYX43_10060 [Burkholderiales bacterium]|nr:hypothetical protein [Burkholderiales bacterium]